jgi:hypothetical protein
MFCVLYSTVFSVLLFLWYFPHTDTSNYVRNIYCIHLRVGFTCVGMGFGESAEVVLSVCDSGYTRYVRNVNTALSTTLS